jgi:hypothetical protein
LNEEIMTTKERPILFSGSMVRAIIEGRKAQTRRIIKNAVSVPATEFCQSDYAGPLPCPYGKPGDRLWVRETFRLPVTFDNQSPSKVGRKCVESGYSRPWCPIKMAADGYTYCEQLLGDFGGDWGKTRVSIHMPRWISRIALEITGVRVERLQDITEADAMAEGVECCSGWIGHAGEPRRIFCDLWKSINGPESWAANPWVWVVEFRRCEQ